MTPRPSRPRLQETAGCAYCVAVTASTPLEAGTSSLGGVWTTTVSSTDGVDPTDCAQVSQLAPSAGGSVTGLVDMSSCVQNFENVDGSATTPVTVTFTVTVSWTYLGVLSGPVPYTGPPLSTGPVTPTAAPPRPHRVRDEPIEPPGSRAMIRRGNDTIVTGARGRHGPRRRPSFRRPSHKERP